MIIIFNEIFTRLQYKNKVCYKIMKIYFKRAYLLEIKTFLCYCT